VGNNGYKIGITDPCQTSNTDPCSVDNQILAEVTRGISDLRFATVNRIVIYNPNGSGASSQCASGSTPNSPYIPGQEPAEVFSPAAGGGYSMQPDAGMGAFTLDNRIQAHPNEGAIGVQVDFSYKSPTPMVSVSISHTEFTVNCFAPRAN
jgi:hypothetical protein